MEDKKRKIIFIGGAPTTGKTTIAKLIAEKIGLPWISTDQIREIIRTTANEKDYPSLFRTNGYTAERFLNEFSAIDTVKMEMDQAEEIWIAIKKFVEDDSVWKDGCIIEGISILPHLIARDFKDDKQIKCVFLIDEDADRMRDVVYNRGLWADAKTYSDGVKEKEVEWALLFSHKLKEEAMQYNYPLIEVGRDKDDVNTLLNILSSE